MNNRSPDAFSDQDETTDRLISRCYQILWHEYPEPTRDPEFRWCDEIAGRAIAEEMPWYTGDPAIRSVVAELVWRMSCEDRSPPE